jgi:hypothetical protein
MNGIKTKEEHKSEINEKNLIITIWNIFFSFLFFLQFGSRPKASAYRSGEYPTIFSFSKEVNSPDLIFDT